MVEETPDSEMDVDLLKVGIHRAMRAQPYWSESLAEVVADEVRAYVRERDYEMAYTRRPAERWPPHWVQAAEVLPEDPDGFGWPT